MNNVIIVVYSENADEQKRQEEYSRVVQKYVKLVGNLLANNEEVIIKAMIPKCALALDEVVREAKRIHDLKEFEKPFVTWEHAVKRVYSDNSNGAVLRKLMAEQEVIMQKIREESKKIGNSNIQFVPDLERPKIEVKYVKLRRSAGGLF